MQLALWLKSNGFRADQVQAFLPGPMATATAMYRSAKNPLRRISRNSESVPIPKGMRQRRLHKAFLRYHDPDNWPMLRAALKRMGHEDLIGNGKRHLIPRWQPGSTSVDKARVRRFMTQQTHGTQEVPRRRPSQRATRAPRSTRR